MEKILVIEDEQNMRESIVEVLGYEGFEVISAANGRVGVQLAQERVPDLIVCDILMPELDGYDVLSELRQQPATASIPFIFLTSKTAWQDFRKGMELGADDYLTKPFEIDDLLAAIRSRLAKRTVTFKHLDDLRLNLSRYVPHELRTPLNIILGASTYLMSFEPGQMPEPGQILEIQQSIYQSALRLQRLIENYILYTRLRLMEYDPDKRRQEEWQTDEMVNLKQFVTSSVVYKAEKSRRRDDLIVEPVDVDIRISNRSLQKIVEELLDNAFKFSQPGTPVCVVTQVKGNRCALSISDRGRGMTAEQVARIEAYMQFEREHYEQQGSGLGLIIARLLTQLHGGDLTIASEANQGTTVTVTFPSPTPARV